MATMTSPPPYMSFGVLQSSTETLSRTTVPHGPIDRRVLDGLSGADYGSLISGMRFLDLVDESRTATPRYHALVKAMKEGEPAFKQALLEIITGAYKPVIGSLDVANGTISQLERVFKDAGVSQGQMLTKTIRFYVKALVYCGVKVSPHITKAKAPRLAAQKNGEMKRVPKTKKTKTAGAPDPKGGATDEAPTGFGRLPIPGLPDAYIQYPAGLTEANCDLFDAMIGVLRTYVKGRSVEKEQKR
jgi:hypothetical protein